MSRFPLKSETITVREQSLTVRELSSKQKGEWAKAVTEDKFRAPGKLCSLVCDPPVTEEEAADWPSDIVEQVVDIARRLSGMAGDDEKKD